MEKLLVLGDIHANWPALKAIFDYIRPERFDGIINTGDFTVYSTFPNETVDWFRKQQKTLCILGNTDLRLLNILAGKKLKKPRKEEKRVMYFWTADHLSNKNHLFLKSLPNKMECVIKNIRIGIFHGTFDDPEETLYPDVPINRFRELAANAPYQVHIMGHSHIPYYKKVGGVHFVNPGSVGRMYDGDPRTSFAIIKVSSKRTAVEHFRIPYPVRKVTASLEKHGLPTIYKRMYEIGKKLN